MAQLLISSRTSKWLALTNLPNCCIVRKMCGIQNNQEGGEIRPLFFIPHSTSIMWHKPQIDRPSASVRSGFPDLITLLYGRKAKVKWNTFQIFSRNQNLLYSLLCRADAERERPYLRSEDPSIWPRFESKVTICFYKIPKALAADRFIAQKKRFF